MLSKKKLTLASTVLLLPFLFVAVGCDDNDTTGGIIDNEPNIVETAIAAGDFNTLVAAVQAAGLLDTLNGPGPFTVFAPTDDAFAKLPPGTVDDLLLPANQDQLKDILLYHVVAGEKLAAEVVASASLETVLGPNVAISMQGSDALVNDATILETDIRTSNGVIHVIDTVLLPE